MINLIVAIGQNNLIGKDIIDNYSKFVGHIIE